MDTLYVGSWGLLSATRTHSVNSVTGVFTILVPFLMKETRSAVVLTRIAKKLRKKTGNHRYRARVEDERASLKTLIWISCTRPVCQYLKTCRAIFHADCVQTLHSLSLSLRASACVSLCHSPYLILMSGTVVDRLCVGHTLCID